MEGTEVYTDEINNLQAEAKEYAAGFRKLGFELMKKQTEPILKAIKWAEEIGKGDCIEPDFSPEVILDNEYLTIEECEDIDENLDSFLDEIDEIHSFIKDAKEYVEDAVTECGFDYGDSRTNECIDDVAVTYKQVIKETFELNLEILREEQEKLIDNQYSDLFVCIVTARRNVLLVSRLAAARVRACVAGEQLPTSTTDTTPKFLQPQSSTHRRMINRINNLSEQPSALLSSS